MCLSALKWSNLWYSTEEKVGIIYLFDTFYSIEGTPIFIRKPVSTLSHKSLPPLEVLIKRYVRSVLKTKTLSLRSKQFVYRRTFRQPVNLFLVNGSTHDNLLGLIQCPGSTVNQSHLLKVDFPAITFTPLRVQLAIVSNRSLNDYKLTHAKKLSVYRGLYLTSTQPHSQNSG